MWELVIDILSDPLKLWMLVILAALEIPAAIILVRFWRKARREGGNAETVGE